MGTQPSSGDLHTHRSPHDRTATVNLASLEVTLTPEQLVALNEPSTPSLNFPAAVITEMSPTFGFGGATVDGVELPVWPQLLTSTARY